MGRPPRRPRDRLLSYREALQSRSAAGEWLHGELFPSESARRFRRLDARRRDHRVAILGGCLMPRRARLTLLSTPPSIAARRKPARPRPGATLGGQDG